VRAAFYRCIVVHTYDATTLLFLLGGWSTQHLPYTERYHATSRSISGTIFTTHINMSSPVDLQGKQSSSHIETVADTSSQNDTIMTDAGDEATHVTQATAGLTLIPPPTETGLNETTENVNYKSRPPTPPSRPDSPYAAYPSRLQPLLPPRNFGAVTDHKVFRSAFPQDRNLDFLDFLGVKTLLCFVDTDPSEGYTEFVRTNNVTRLRIDISPNKEGKVKTTVDSICEALLVVLDATNYPLYIHCNQGRHRTGCVIACMRKVQGWPMEAIVAEYETYSNPKMRDGDLEFIRNVFQPESLLGYAKQHGQFGRRPSLMSLLHSGLLDVEKFVRMMGSTDGVAPSNASLKSEISKPDSAIDMTSGTLDPTLLISGIADPRESEISVEECGPMSPPVIDEHAQMGYLG
jgi:tyrosine-protein phosphatase SIW14